MAHFTEICEFGAVHRTCKCPDDNKAVFTIECWTPELHDTADEPPFPDPQEEEFAPDPYFDGLTGSEVFGELDRLDEEDWHNRMQEQMWYEEYYREGGW
jgi:hypothetical protein